MSEDIKQDEAFNPFKYTDMFNQLYHYYNDVWCESCDGLPRNKADRWRHRAVSGQQQD